ncbi:hypothetical protein EDEG_01813 [Edhazardia aedis USNM 41457]|uniref:T-complex protein 1 subunit delta n=1 Tax=Edhazardia aedis (strain USNM 41457) TaxID=1003232 RepID=J8ZW39_EDHAE|nr:hypothetical protein EDEG_01813 [Edhazardia aedis USNM 41457]|eukprot:EJW03903.1 hypothetical protein EDEG_01813 [Edhazardia aedis USNM 41457]
MQTERKKTTTESITQAAITLASSLSTSLGPRGCDKMIIKDGKPLITNDGATILKTLSYYHPINKMLCDLSQTQDKNCGDGTTSVVVLAGSILRQCSDLIKKGVHPTVLAKALDKIKIDCMDYIDKVKISIGDEKFNKEKFDIYLTQPQIGNIEKKDIDYMNDKSDSFYIKYKDSLLKAVTTSLSSKLIASSVVEFAPIAVDACLKVNGKIVDIQVIKKIGGAVEDVRLRKTFVLANNIKNPVIKEKASDDKFSKKVKFAVLQFGISPPKPNLDYKISLTESKLVEQIPKQEREYLLNMCAKIKKSGAELVILQKSLLRESISELGQSYLTRLGVIIIDDIEREDIAKICDKFNLQPSVDPDYINIGECTIEEKLENEALITEILSDDACSIVVRGSDQIITDEAERSLHDAICVVKCLFDDPYLVPGGGAVEAGISQFLVKKSNEFYSNQDVLSSKNEHNQNYILYSEKYIYEQISKAFEEIPYMLAQNTGMDPVVQVNFLTSKIAENPTFGINVRSNTISCMLDENVVQPAKVSKSVISLALETVATIIKIDDILPSKR